MKYAIIGTGKTGGHVINLLNKREMEHTAFNSKSKIDAQILSAFDIIICFTPKDALKNILPDLIASKVPVVLGTTGFEWTQEIKDTIKNEGLRWVYAHNFSLGMNIVHKMINIMNHADKISNNFDINIHEVHHMQKKDAPSGTALHWADWTGQETTITHERIGDIVGDHELTLNLEGEKITIRHQALSRDVFAEGALWAANKILNQSQQIPFGLTNFENLTMQELL